MNTLSILWHYNLGGCLVAKERNKANIFRLNILWLHLNLPDDKVIYEQKCESHPIAPNILVY